MRCSPSGHFIRNVGTAGTGKGGLEGPLTIAFDPATNDMYVANRVSHRIDEFTEAGEFVRAFGWGVSNGEARLETCTTSCEAGVSGFGVDSLPIRWEWQWVLPVTCG